MLEIRDLHAGYGSTEILHGIDLTVPSGSVTAIVGPNGCGKSTLLKTIAGILPARGSICLDETAMNSLPPGQRAQLAAYLPQSRPAGDITVERMVLHGRFPYLSYPRRYRREDLEVTREAMAVMGLEELAQRNLNTLSGGQRQKVYLAMILAQQTPLVLLDEPTTYLDIAHQMQTLSQARFLAEQGKTVVMVIHDLPAALRCADTLAVMGEGRVLIQGTPEEVWHSGCLDTAFGVQVERIATGDGWQYYYRERSGKDESFSHVR